MDVEAARHQLAPRAPGVWRLPRGAGFAILVHEGVRAVRDDAAAVVIHFEVGRQHRPQPLGIATFEGEGEEFGIARGHGASQRLAFGKRDLVGRSGGRHQAQQDQHRLSTVL